MNRTLIGLSLACLSPLAAAQSTVLVGPHGYACQSGDLVLGSATLGDASTAGTVTFDYDATTAVLRLLVANTSASAAGNSPVLTTIWFSAPYGTVTGATLLAQSPPTRHPFGLTFDNDARQKHNRAGCLGNFVFQLAIADLRDGIKTTPVEFRLQLAGPAVRGLSSEAFAAATSRTGTRDVNVALQFEARNSGEKLVLGNTDLCRTAVFLRGTPRIGENIAICVAGSNDCHAYLLASAVPGPVTIFGITLPIGLPLIDSFPLGYFSEGVYERSLPVSIPNHLSLVGLSFYFANLSYPWGSPELFTFSPAFTVTVQ